LGSELSDAKRDLQKYHGNEIPVTDAVSIVARVTGIRVHLLRDDEISEALEYARRLIASENVRQGPYNVKNEIVKASREAWTDLTPPARPLVGSLWAGKTGVDLVVTTLDHVQTKEKILSMIANVLEQRKRYPLGRARTTPR
jgi:ATP-dependent Clp protease ATP-binding subunit ClpA